MDSALAGYRDVFVAAIVPAGACGSRNRIRHLVRPYAFVSDGLCKIARPAVGMRGMSAAAFALGKALVDAVSVGLAGNDENAAVRPGGGREQSRACQNAGKNPSHRKNMHDVPEKKERIAAGLPRRMPAISRQNKAFMGRGLDAIFLLLHVRRNERSPRHLWHLPRDYGLAIRWLRPSLISP